VGECNHSLESSEVSWISLYVGFVKLLFILHIKVEKTEFLGWMFV
jgi:hypothetical protein